MSISRALLDDVTDGIVAGLAAALPSGAPSTAHALATGHDPLEAARAAGTIVAADDASSTALLAAAVPVHLSLSIGWGLVLAITLPQRHAVVAGALAGLAIAAVDLSAARLWWPRIAALPAGPQIADHVAFGAIAGYAIARRRARRHAYERRGESP